MQDLIEKTAVLIEAMPYIQKFRGEIVVVKFGGHAMGDAEAMRRFARDIVLMKLNAVGLRGAASLRISEVSGGMARRIALARALYRDPFLVVLDEPNSSLDEAGDAALAKAIATRARDHRCDRDAVLPRWLVQAFYRQCLTANQHSVSHAALARGHQLALEVREIGAQGAHSLCGRGHHCSYNLRNV